MRMTGRRLGIVSLKIDVIYCMALGAAVAITARQIAAVVPLPAVAIAVIGVAVVAWAGMVAWMAANLPLRLVLRTVMIANVVAATAIVAFSITTAAVLVLLSILAIAADVLAFAGSQALALSRLRAEPATGPFPR
jgi:hypothetical protein